MAKVEEELVDRLSITVDVSDKECGILLYTVGSGSRTMEACCQGWFIHLPRGTFLYLPITATVSKHLSQTLHFLGFVSLAIGVLLMLLTAILYGNPRLKNIAKSLIQIGWGLLSITLGYGSA